MGHGNARCISLLHIEFKFCFLYKVIHAEEGIVGMKVLTRKAEPNEEVLLFLQFRLKQALPNINCAIENLT